MLCISDISYAKIFCMCFLECVVYTLDLNLGLLERISDSRPVSSDTSSFQSSRCLQIASQFKLPHVAELS